MAAVLAGVLGREVAACFQRHLSRQGSTVLNNHRIIQPAPLEFKVRFFNRSITNNIKDIQHDLSSEMSQRQNGLMTKRLSKNVVATATGISNKQSKDRKKNRKAWRKKKYHMTNASSSFAELLRNQGKDYAPQFSGKNLLHTNSIFRKDILLNQMQTDSKAARFKEEQGNIIHDEGGAIQKQQATHVDYFGGVDTAERLKRKMAELIVWDETGKKNHTMNSVVKSRPKLFEDFAPRTVIEVIHNEKKPKVSKKKTLKDSLQYLEDYLEKRERDIARKSWMPKDWLEAHGTGDDKSLQKKQKQRYNDSRFALNTDDVMVNGAGNPQPQGLSITNIPKIFSLNGTLTGLTSKARVQSKRDSSYVYDLKIPVHQSDSIIPINRHRTDKVGKMKKDTSFNHEPILRVMPQELANNTPVPNQPTSRMSVDEEKEWWTKELKARKEKYSTVLDAINSKSPASQYLERLHQKYPEIRNNEIHAFSKNASSISEVQNQTNQQLGSKERSSTITHGNISPINASRVPKENLYPFVSDNNAASQQPERRKWKSIISLEPETASPNHQNSHHKLKVEKSKETQDGSSSAPILLPPPAVKVKYLPFGMPNNGSFFAPNTAVNLKVNSSAFPMGSYEDSDSLVRTSLKSMTRSKEKQPTGSKKTTKKQKRKQKEKQKGEEQLTPVNQPKTKPVNNKNWVELLGNKTSLKDSLAQAKMERILILADKMRDNPTDPLPIFSKDERSQTAEEPLPPLPQKLDAQSLYRNLTRMPNLEHRVNDGASAINNEGTHGPSLYFSDVKEGKKKNRKKKKGKRILESAKIKDNELSPRSKLNPGLPNLMFNSLDGFGTMKLEQVEGPGFTAKTPSTEFAKVNPNCQQRTCKDSSSKTQDEGEVTWGSVATRCTKPRSLPNANTLFLEEQMRRYESALARFREQSARDGSKKKSKKNGKSSSNPRIYV